MVLVAFSGLFSGSPGSWGSLKMSGSVHYVLGWYRIVKVTIGQWKRLQNSENECWISEILNITCCLQALVAGLLLVVEVLVIDDRDLRGGGGGGGHDLRDRLDGLERRCWKEKCYEGTSPLERGMVPPPGPLATWTSWMTREIKKFTYARYRARHSQCFYFYFYFLNLTTYTIVNELIFPN